MSPHVGVEKTKRGLYEVLQENAGVNVVQLADQKFLLTPDQLLLRKMDEDYEAIIVNLHLTKYRIS